MYFEKAAYWYIDCLLILAASIISIIQRQKEENIATECVMEGGMTLFSFSVIAEGRTTAWTGHCKGNRVCFIFSQGPSKELR